MPASFLPASRRARQRASPPGNLFNKSSWASAGGFPGSNYLVVGAPRTFVLNASVDF